MVDHDIDDNGDADDIFVFDNRCIAMFPSFFLTSYHLNIKHYAQELLKFKTKGGSVDVRQLLPGPGNDYRCVKKNGKRNCSLDSCFGL